MAADQQCAAPPAAAPEPPEPWKLTGVDVFSGIGGITLALAPFVQTVQYCEIDRFCQSVLLQRMTENRLDRAPIHSDVRNLYVSPAVKPDMICGGFPCQDISCIGLQKGITGGEKSSMFYEVMRLVDATPSVEILFLENVANILNCGIREVVEESTKRGFTLQWQMRSAQAHGAPHVRTRWFMLACRGRGAEKVARCVSHVLQAQAEGRGAPHVVPDVPHGNVWEGSEPQTRASFRPAVRADPSYDDHWPSRCASLGNAVVPTVARIAFVELAQNARRWRDYVQVMSDYGAPVGDVKHPFPEAAIVSDDGTLFALPKKRTVAQRHSVGIVAPGSSRTSGGGNLGLVTYDNYPTPRRGITHASTPTDRSVRDLPNILVYCTATADYLRSLGFEPPADRPLHNCLVPSVNYIEWMQGYPADWTRIAYDEGSMSVPMPPARASVSRASAEATARQAILDDADAEEGGTCRDDEAVTGFDEDGVPAPTVGSRRRSAACGNGSGSGGSTGRLHGMHLFMRDNPGRDVPTIAKMWKALTDAERASFSERAKAMYSTA